MLAQSVLSVIFSFPFPLRLVLQLRDQARIYLHVDGSKQPESPADGL
jgi:hypothetical protein